MMIMLLKQINKIVLGSCCLFLLIPLPVAAEDDKSKEKGQMDVKIDRIMQGESGDEQSSEKTELEIKLPELFTEETRTTIESVKGENKETLEETEQALFTINVEGNPTIADTKEYLFTSKYVAPDTSTYNQQNNEGDSSWFNTVLITGLSGLACVIGAGVYIMAQRLGS